jgi:hypothetical protein
MTDEAIVKMLFERSEKAWTKLIENTGGNAAA